MMMNSFTVIAGLLALTACPLVSSQYYGQGYNSGGVYGGNPYSNNGGYYGPYQESYYQQPYGGGGNSYGGGGGQQYSNSGYNDVKSYGGDNYNSGGQGYGVKSYQDSSSAYTNDGYGQGYSNKSYEDSYPTYKNDGYGGQNTKTCASPQKCCKARRNRHPYAKQICDGCGNNVCNTNDPNHWSRVQTAKPTKKPTTNDWVWNNNGASKWGNDGSCCQTLDSCPLSFPIRTDTLVLSEMGNQRLRLRVCCKSSRNSWGGDRWGGDRWGGDRWGGGNKYEPTMSPTLPLPTLAPTTSPTTSPIDRRRELMYGDAYGSGNSYQGNPYVNNGGYYGPYEETFYQQPYGGNNYGGGYGGGNDYSGVGQGYSGSTYQVSNSAYDKKSYGDGYYGGNDYGGNDYGGNDYGGNNYGTKNYGNDYYGEDKYPSVADISTKQSFTYLERCPSPYEPTMQPTLSPTLSPMRRRPTRR